MTKTRTESDSFGPIEVPAEALWGAQTARSLHFFAIGEQRMPLPVIHALAWVKWAAARVNGDLQRLDAGKAQAIAAAARRVVAGRIRCRVPALGVADRLGHAEQHERQRSGGAPGCSRARRRGAAQAQAAPAREASIRTMT